MNCADISLFNKINLVWINPFFDWLMPTLSQGNKSPWFWLLIAHLVGFLLWKGTARHRYFVLCLAVGVALSNELCDFLKHNIHSPRPCNVLDYVRLPIGSLQSYGFPSAHSSNMMALAFMTFLFFPRKGWIAFLLPILVGYSRIYNGVHFPLQVLGGYCTGALVALVCFGIYWKLIGHKITPKLSPKLKATSGVKL